MTDMQDTRIPVTLLTGFLGSGKTTLLNHWVKQPELGECAVLIMSSARWGWITIWCSRWMSR